ncbi:MAG: type II toxin-antitoxin system VapC family toxin [Rhodospirillaceae bacterium]|nr:type II toxin-antitoxin system VapC family toxin [Rhodospirillaceae bacterium]
MSTVVIDTSALVAILRQEHQAQALSDCLDRFTRRLFSAANYVELGTVLAGRRPADRASLVRDLDRILDVAEIEVAPFTADLARLALTARARFGNGLGAAARLNLGDSFSYALARANNAPLLFVGNDFLKTDIVDAMLN